MFEALLQQVKRAQAEYDFELARCDDPYRLAHILCQFKLRLTMLEGEARQMVKELEDA